jgi:O-antigen ligase
MTPEMTPPAGPPGASSYFVATRPDLTASVFEGDARRRRAQLLLFAILLAAGVGTTFVAFGLDSPILPAVLLLAVAAPVLLWHYPKVTLFAVFGATCLLELNPTGFPDDVTGRIPFFWNVNTIFQVYAHANLKAVPVNALEVLLLLAFACTAVRSVFSGMARVKGGPLILPICVYLGFVGLAWVIGIATGGDFKVSLQETRAQFYFLAAYLMGVYLAPDKRTTRALFWTFAVCVALKAALYAFRRFVTLGGQPLPDQGVGSHEEAFFFVSYLTLLGALSLTGTGRGHPLRRLHGLLWALAPVVAVGLLVTNRRAATAAMVLGTVLLFLGAFRAFPSRRRLIVVLATVLGVASFGYYQAFKNSDGLLGQPARAIRSQFTPDPRDASSNDYRVAENANILATMREAPVFGYGYGKPMRIEVPMPDISDKYLWWNILPHNQILWVWMRTGTLGFFAFWMMIAAVLMRACRVLRRDGEDAEAKEPKQVALFALVLVLNLLLFGLFDLQLSNFRDMLFTGLWAGVLAGLPVAAEMVKAGEKKEAAAQ